MDNNSRSGFVFISYKREEARTAESLREALVKQGFNVWWDEDLQCGQAWAEKLDAAVQDAACIVVLWSARAVASQWVRHEASQAIARDVYAPCRIELVQLDSPYDRIQATDLIGWNGDNEHGGFRNLMARVDTLVPAPVSLSRRIRRWLHSNFVRLIASGIAIFAIWLLVTIFLAQEADRRGKVYDCSASPALRSALAREMYSTSKNLSQICLRGTDLTEVDFSMANLSGANLSNVDLTDADLSNANLTDANLNDSFLDGTNLTDANLSGANLKEAFLLTATLTNACADPPPIGWQRNYGTLPPCFKLSATPLLLQTREEEDVSDITEAEIEHVVQPEPK